MKRMLLSLIIAACAASIYGQKNSLDDFFNSYSDREGYTIVTINGNLFGLLKNFDEDAELDDMERKITSIRIIAREKENTFSADNFLSELKGALKHGKYEELITVKEHDSDLRFMVRSEGEVIREVLVIASGEEDAVIQIQGKLTREDVTRMSEKHGERLALLETLETSEK
jgi:hypothetical protein